MRNKNCSEAVLDNTKRQAWKMLKDCGPHAQHDAIMDNNGNIFIGQVKPDVKKGIPYFTSSWCLTYNGGQRYGFTLIELLVVVLIIGILANIALPQYQKAVEKSRMAEALVMLRAIAKANQARFMATGEYTKHIDELDIEVPGEDAVLSGMRRKETKNFQFGARAAHANANDRIAVANRLPFATFYAFTIYTDGAVCCYGYVSKGRTLCKQLSGGIINEGHLADGGKKCYEVNF